jgi:hypothetical protein
MKKIIYLVYVALFLFSSLLISAQAPSIPAVPPTKTANKVVSLFSDVYTSPVNLVPIAWGGTGSITFTDIATDEVMKVTDVNYFQVMFDNADAPTMLNMSNMTHIHFDVFRRADENIDWYQFGFKTGADIVDAMKDIPWMNPGEWYYFDYLLTDFPGLDKTKISGLKLCSKAGSLYFDNIYFYNDNLNSIGNVEKAKINVSSWMKDELNISSEETISRVEIYNICGQRVLAANEGNTTAKIDVSKLVAGTYIVVIEQADGAKITQKAVKQ